MSTSALPPPALVADDDGLDRLVQALAPCPVVAVDTESNSLHAYRECVCLIQFSAISGFPKEHKYPISLDFTG